MRYLLLIQALFAVTVLFASRPLEPRKARVVHARYVKLDRLSTLSDNLIREIIVPVDDDQRVFLCRHKGASLCFSGSSTITLMRSSNYGVSWDSVGPVISLLFDVSITSVVDIGGVLVAYFNVENTSSASGALSVAEVKWGYGTSAIYVTQSYDAGKSWSAPKVAIKHNTVNLERAVITHLPKGRGGGFIALMNRENGRGFLISKSRDGVSWSYPEYVQNSFYGKFASFEVKGKRAYILYYDQSNIYLWRGSYESLEVSAMNHMDDFFMEHNNAKQPPHFVKVGKLSGYLCD